LNVDFEPEEAPEPSRIIEALLLTAGAPLSVERLKSLTDIEDGREIRALVEELRIEYLETGRSFAIEEVGGGFRLLTRPEYAPWPSSPIASPSSVRRSRRSGEWMSGVPSGTSSSGAF
jgi:segregation and condensation protein B